MEASLNQFHEHNVRKILEFDILMKKFFEGAETKFSEFQLRVGRESCTKNCLLNTACLETQN